MSNHKTEEKEIQDFIDEWMEDNMEDVKMVPKTIRIDRHFSVFQTFYFDVMLPEHSEDEFMGHEVVEAFIAAGIDWCMPDKEDYGSCDDEFFINDRTMTKEDLREHKQTHDKSNSFWLFDARGIELCRVCEECEQQVSLSYSDKVMGRAGKYTDQVDEQIEPD